MKRILVSLFILSLQTGAAFAADSAPEEDMILKDCLSSCSKTMDEAVKNCDQLYDSAYAFQEHNQCLFDAQDRYDDCQKECQGNYEKQ